MSVSLDGSIAGPNAGPGNGLGDGGDRLHQWFADPDSGVLGRPAPSRRLPERTEASPTRSTRGPAETLPNAEVPSEVTHSLAPASHQEQDSDGSPGKGTSSGNTSGRRGRPREAVS